LVVSTGGAVPARQIVIQTGQQQQQQQQQQAIIRPVVGCQVETTATNTTATAVPSTDPPQLGSSTILQDLLRKGSEEQGLCASKLVGCSCSVPACLGWKENSSLLVVASVPLLFLLIILTVG
jgi:hypothetical protein